MKVVLCSSKSPVFCCRSFHAVFRFEHDSGAENQLDEVISQFGSLTQSNGNSAGEENPGPADQLSLAMAVRTNDFISLERQFQRPFDHELIFDESCLGNLQFTLA